MNLDHGFLLSPFRIRESADDFDETLKLASFAGNTYEVTTGGRSAG